MLGIYKRTSVLQHLFRADHHNQDEHGNEPEPGKS